MIPRNRTIDRLGALFFLGLVLFLPPVLLVFNRPERVLGVPILFLYIFCAWAAVIVLAKLATRGMSFEAAPDTAAKPREHPSEEQRDA